MAEPGGAQAALRLDAPGLEWIQRRQRRARRAALAAAKEFGERRHLRLRVAQSRQDRLQVREALAGPEGRGPNALQTQAL